MPMNHVRWPLRTAATLWALAALTAEARIAIAPGTYTLKALILSQDGQSFAILNPGTTSKMQLFLKGDELRKLSEAFMDCYRIRIRVPQAIEGTDHAEVDLISAEACGAESASLFVGNDLQVLDTPAVP